MKYPKLIKTESFTSGLEYPQKSREKWQFNKKSFEVEVIKGKYLEFAKLKSFDKSGYQEKVKRYRQIRVNYFKNSNNLEEVKKCYFCQIPVNKKIFSIVAKIYEAQYIQCPKCSLVFLSKRPREKFLTKLYIKNQEYASTYTDKKSLKIRLDQVVLPKIKWLEENYQKSYGEKPKSILDVGAGGGHFVYLGKRRGYMTEGVEISEPSIKFAKENFGVELKRLDFLRFPSGKKYDVITFWGVIEHLANPRQFIKKAITLLTPKGMLVIQGPNFYSLSTGIQKNFPDSVIRHLDPLSHIQIFTENSLVWLLLEFGLAPIAVWYFGMDIYELFTQLSNLNYDFIPKVNPIINNIQKMVDLGKISDSIIMAATNKK